MKEVDWGSVPKSDTGTALGICVGSVDSESVEALREVGSRLDNP